MSHWNTATGLVLGPLPIPAIPSSDPRIAWNSRFGGNRGDREGSSATHVFVGILHINLAVVIELGGQAQVAVPE